MCPTDPNTATISALLASLGHMRWSLILSWDRGEWTVSKWEWMSEWMCEFEVKGTVSGKCVCYVDRPHEGSERRGREVGAVECVVAGLWDGEVAVQLEAERVGGGAVG